MGTEAQGGWGAVIFMNKITRESKLEKKNSCQSSDQNEYGQPMPMIFYVIWLRQIQRVTQREAQAMTSRFTLILYQGF